jgi:hypothetical protein
MRRSGGPSPPPNGARALEACTIAVIAGGIAIGVVGEAD